MDFHRYDIQNHTIQVFNHGAGADVINLGNGNPALLADFVHIVQDRVGLLA
jgi:hypothetical protein